MATSSWRCGIRSKYRARVSQDPEDNYRLDPKKSAAENAYDIYTALCCRDTRDTKRLFLLNGLATLCEQQHQQQQQHQQELHERKASQTLAAASTSHLQLQPPGKQHANRNIGFSTEELFYCLSASLIHTFTQVRAAALRTIRYALSTPKDIKIFNSMQLQHLLCRSIDVMLKNDDERVQAFKLIRKMLSISPEDVSPVVVRCLVSLADTGMEDGDNMLRACLATLSEFAVLNPTLLIVCGGVTSITRNVLECHNPRIAESLCGVLLYLLEWPHTRNISGVRLDCLAAPYCDFTYRLGIMDKNKDARELRYTSCRLALLSVLRSWTGTIEFCDPSKPSGLKAIVDALYLNQIEVRKAIMDLLYEVLALPQPPWTDDYTVALQAVDPADFQDAWLLSNGFVAAEGRSILPSLAARAPNVCEQHVALLLYCFLETGLLNALVEVVVSNDPHLSVRATILIGKITHLMHTHLPADICSTSPALPTLVSHATQGNQHANAAITALQNYQKMLRNRPASCSLFLDSIIQRGGLVHTRLFRRCLNAQVDTHTGASNALHIPAIGTANTLPATGSSDRQRLDSVSSSDESNSQTSTTRRSSFRWKHRLLPFMENLRVNRLIKESNVGATTDKSQWDWDVIITILRLNMRRKLDDNLLKFFTELVKYFKPSKSYFSHQDLLLGRGVRSNVTACLDMIDWLLSCRELQSTRLLTDLFTDVSQQLLAVATSSRTHDCLFSPQHMNNTMCQQYFLFIGRMCRTQKGINILLNTMIFEYLINIVRNTDHVCYVKLIVSGLDYTLESVTRKVLEKALTSAKTRSGRLYATQFLGVLLRARLPNFEVWGIPLIIQQTKDPDRGVVLAAMDVLEEACHEKYYLEEIVPIWPNLKPLGDVGRPLMARYYSLSRGLNHERAKIKEEIEYWKNGFNKRYVLLVEADTHSSLTLHVRNEDGYYSRRNCNTRPVMVPPNICPHLYGQMVQTAQGTTAMRKYADLPHLIEVISRGKCSDEADCLELKAAIWAVGHASTHSNGVEYFLELGSRIYEKLVLLATKCEVYSIRATCFNVLGLIGGTNAGANILFKLNWLSVRHDRNTMWPVHQPEDWLSSNFTPVRHHYEDMPPYNYTGIEDQIDGSYYTGSYWNLLLGSSSSAAKDGQGGGGPAGSSDVHDATTTTTAESTRTTSDEAAKCSSATASAKSKTLPEGTYIRHGKHQRSLSESKTTDVISLIGGGVGGGGMYHHQHRVRYNSCTDSNTSGVSSCESVTVRGAGGMVVGDFQQFPLSPIPSMSNINELPTHKSYFRRISLIGTSYLRNDISPVDIKGYAQLRSLRRHCRPMLSESAADMYDIIDRTEGALSSAASSVGRKSSFGSFDRRLKVRSLDRTHMLTNLSMDEMQVPLPSLAPPKFLSQNDLKGPCYAGICLPKNLLDLFPVRNYLRTYVSRDIQDQDLMDINLLTAKQQFLNDSLNNEGGDESSVISSLSDVSSVSKRTKWQGTKHGRSNCMQCCRDRRQQTHSQRLDSEALLEYSGRKPSAVATAGLMADISFHSPESALSEESMPDRLTANILYNVCRLANPVSAKQSKMALLELKQKHPNSFQDICLYSEVCKTLGRASFRMMARRFLQELFLDLNFDAFYTEPTDILSKKDTDFAPMSKAEKRLSAGSSVGFEVAHPKAYDRETLKAASTAMGTCLSAAAKMIGGGSATNTVSPTTGTGPPPSALPNHHIKPHLKSQPLASVYESSCENLLEQSPRMLKSQSPAATLKAQAAERLGNPKEAAAPAPPSPPEYPNELRITSDDEDDDDDDEVEELRRKWAVDEVDSVPGAPSSAGEHQQPHSHQQQQQRQRPTAVSPASSSTNAHSLTPQPAYVSSGSINTPIGSDQATNSSSNRSSICTISHQPLTSATSVAAGATTSTGVENENKKFTRGRCYTFELDLSCTKNKFPITDRTRQHPTTSATPKSDEAASAEDHVERRLQRGRSFMRQAYSVDASYTSGAGKLLNNNVDAGETGPASNTTAATPYVLNLSSPTCTNPPTSYTITKSLGGTFAKPIGSLFCEKRLQSSKSEAVLSAQMPAAVTKAAQATAE